MPEIAGVEDVTVALPHLVGGEGVLATLPLALNEEEATGLNASARLIRDVIDAMEASE
jgi:L-lactate dehydrogenase